jgi:polysaccharide pyruvyl transferase WcaK-like protein
MSLQTFLTKYRRPPRGPRISFYGNFGAGNLGNECTLQAIINQILRRSPDAQLLCFCTNPEDVRARHHIDSLPSEAVKKADVLGALGPQGCLRRTLRIPFQRLPLELLHWTKTLRALRGMDMLVVAGTGIVSDHLCGPLGWPYDIFKLSTFAALCRVRVVFLSVGVGPLQHSLSRRFIRVALTLAHHRSYRDQASKQYLEEIGFNTGADTVYPDVAFALGPASFGSAVPACGRRIVGLGLKDYGTFDRLDRTSSKAFTDYLNTMAAFVTWLQQRGYGVRLLAGDIQYDTGVIEQFVNILKSRNIPTDPPLLMAEPAQTVPELLRQIAETEVVISARYHNLVLALIQDKPIIALSDHAKLDSLATDLGLGRYLLPLATLRPDALIERFKQLEPEVQRLSFYIRAEVTQYRQALDSLYASLFTADRAAGGPAKPAFDFGGVLDRSVSTDRPG